MTRLVEVLGGVFVFGVVAAAHMTALEADSQVNPGVAHLQAFLAAPRVAGEVGGVGF